MFSQVSHVFASFALAQHAEEALCMFEQNGLEAMLACFALACAESDAGTFTF